MSMKAAAVVGSVVIMLMLAPYVLGPQLIMFIVLALAAAPFVRAAISIGGQRHENVDHVDQGRDGHGGTGDTAAPAPRAVLCGSANRHADLRGGRGRPEHAVLANSCTSDEHR